MELQKKILHHSDISKIAKNTGVSGAGEVISNVLGYVMSIVITRTVGPAVFGVFNIANVVNWLAHVFSNAGLNQGMLRYVAFYKGKGDLQRLKGSILFSTKVVFAMSLLLSIIVFLLSDLIAKNIFRNPDVGFAIKVLIVSLPFLALGELWVKVIQAFHAITYQVYIQKIYQPVTRFIFLIVLFYLGLKLVGVLLASLFSIFLGFLLALYYLLKITKVNKRSPEAIYEKKEILLYSLPLSLSQFMGIITFYIDVLMLGYFKTTVDVGVYSAVSKVGMLILLPLTAFNTIFAPMISEIYSRKEMNKLEDLFKTVTKWIFTLSFPVYLLFVLLAEPIMGIFGQGFVVGAIALIYFATGEIVNAGVGSVGYMLMMTGRSRIVLYNSILFGVLNVFLNYLLIPKYGIVGAAVATGLSIAVINLLRLIEVYYYMKIHPFKLSCLKPFFAGLLTFLVVKLSTYSQLQISTVQMIVFAIVFTGLYIFFIFVFKLEEEDKYILKLIYKKMGITNAE